MKDIYHFYLQRLSEAGVNCAILRSPRDWESVSDLDVISDETEVLSHALIKLGFMEIAKEDDHAWYVKYDGETKSWIHFDINRRLRFDKFIFPPSFIASILAEDSPDGCYQLNAAHEAILLIFHAAIHKGKFGPEYLQRITAVDRREIEKYVEQYSFLPEVVTHYYDLAQAAFTGEVSPLKAVRAIRKALGAQPFWFQRIQERLVWIAGLPRAIFRPRTVAVLGCDGAGKTTITDALGAMPHPRIFRQYMGVDNSSEQSYFIRIVFRPLKWLMLRTRKTSLLGLIVRLALALLRYADFWIRILRNFYPLIGKTNILLLDRYPCDVYFRKPERWSEFVFIWCFPRPWFAILLAGDSNAIHHRKPELTTKEIEITLSEYRDKLAKHKFKYCEIDTTSNDSAKSIQQVAAEIIKCLADVKRDRILP
ncbi:hypothetical protein N8626_01875 [bacterium]|nr:hypothetical protein [bacterium]